MTEILGLDLGVSIPSLVSSSSVGNMITWIIVIILIFISAILLIWWYLNNRHYNLTIQVFENIAGLGYRPVYKDKARLVKIGDSGEEILFLRRKKQFKAAYGRKMGDKTYWFAIGQDGYWYNCILGDLDAKMGMLDIEPIDRDMRYMHVAIRKNIKDRYEEEGKWQKYIPTIISFFLIIILFVGSWFLIDRIGELMTQSAKSIDTLKIATENIIKSNDLTQKSLAHIDTILSGGSGLR